MNIENYDTLTQTSAHENTSDKYSFIPTSRVLSVLADYGFQPVKVNEARTRIVENRGFQKHMVRLRQERHLQTNVGDEFPEIVITTSHLGNSSFRGMLGWFRQWCSNGAVVGNTLSDFRVLHKGYADDQVAQGIEHMLKFIPDLEETVDRFRSIALSEDERQAFAKSAIELRFDTENNVYVDPRQLTYTRRSADREPTLWNTFNVVQEHLIKGGVRTVNANRQRRRAKEVKSVDENIRINRALWTLTEEMAKLKTA